MAYEHGIWQRLSTPAAPQGGDTLTISTSWQSFATNVVIPASAFILHRSFRVEAWGTINLTGAVLSIQSQIVLNSTSVISSPTISLAVLSNGGFYGNFVFDVITTGASGVIEAQGNATFQTAATVMTPVQFLNTAQITGLNLTTDQTLALQVKALTGLGVGTLQLRMLRAEATMVQ